MPGPMLLIEATTELNAATIGMPESSSRNVRTAIAWKYRKMNASTDWAMRSGITLPPMRTGITADGCTSSFISRCAWRASSRVRNILMPPPVEPVLHTTELRNSIHIGANTGQRS